MHTFLISTSAVALAEIGDKTQLLSLVLAARFRRPLLIIVGVLAATLINHALAGAVGAWLGALLTPALMRWVLAASFLAMGIWVLIPDRFDANSHTGHARQLGVLTTTIATFFMAEMGDKTQLATVALAARYHDYLSVVAGTTFGMMLANVPVILIGDRLAQQLPTRLLQSIAAVIFVVIGIFAWSGNGA